MAARLGDSARAETLRGQAEELRAAMEATASDGAWCRRGYYDDGAPLGSAESAECQIDSVAQSWAVLSLAAEKSPVAAAMEALVRRLVKEPEGLILLLAPPFAESTGDPGYIRSYPPGVRENGGSTRMRRSGFCRRCSSSATSSTPWTCSSGCFRSAAR